MKKFLLIIFSLLIGLAVFSQPASFDAAKLLQPRTGTQTLVTDYTNTLTPQQQQALEAKLVAYDDSTSTQIAVVVIPNLGGDDVADYNVKLLRAWGVGGKKHNNGVVLLIAKDDRKLNISTGYGAEGALPDVLAKSIIDNVIVPDLKENDYYRGIDQGTDAIMAALRGEYHEARQRTSSSGGGSIIFFIIIIIVIIIIFSNRGGGGNNYMSRRGSGIANALLWSTLFNGGGGGGGGWSGGGGGGGGGFGGFGGGSGGGGGASGSW